MTRMKGQSSTAGRRRPTDGRPGEDDRLVPGQQGPGGREMVNRRLWFRGGPKPARPMFDRLGSAEAQALSLGLDEEVEPCYTTRVIRIDARPRSAIRRLLFVNQYYWPDHASTAQHLTDLAESLARAGIRVPRPLRQGRYGSDEPAPTGARGPRTASTSTASPPRPWVGRTR